MNADQSVGGASLEGETTQLVIDGGSRRGRRVGTRPLEEFYSSDRIDNMDDDPDYSDGGMDDEDEESHSSSRESDDDDEQGDDNDDEKVMVELCRKLRRLVPKYKKSRALSPGVVRSVNNLMNSAGDFIDKVESRQRGGRQCRKRKRQISSSSSSSSSSGQTPSASSSFGKRSNDSTQRQSGRNEKRSRTMRLDEHTRRKATGKPRTFKCPDCESSFTRADHLKTHKESKHDMVKFPCVKCGQDFSTKGCMTRHVLAVHDQKKYNCRHCGKACTRQEYLTKHLKDFHPDA